MLMAVRKHFWWNKPCRKSPSFHVAEVNPSRLDLSVSSGFELVILSFIRRGFPVIGFPQARHLALVLGSLPGRIKLPESLFHQIRVLSLHFDSCRACFFTERNYFESAVFCARPATLDLGDVADSTRPICQYRVDEALLEGTEGLSC